MHDWRAVQGSQMSEFAVIFKMIGIAGANFFCFVVRGCWRCESLLASRFARASPVSDVSHPPFSAVLHTTAFSSKIQAVR